MTIEAKPIAIDKDQARDLYRKYKTHQNYSGPVDYEIQRTYQLIAQGRVVIKALESIVAAGLGEDRLPKLAIARADQPKCWLHPRTDGSATMLINNRALRRNNEAPGKAFDFPPGSFPGIQNHRWSYEAIVPPVPVYLRPKRGLANYHILWEAEWSKVVPVDPMLLRRIGKGDLWLVCAAWDLTEVERAVLASRLNA